MLHVANKYPHTRHFAHSFYYVLPNLVTLIGLCLGLTAIRFAVEGRFELSVIFIGKKSEAGTQPLDELLDEFNIEITPVDRPMVIHGRHGCAKYGKGHNPADLNMGDLFSYSLAKSLDLSLYFEGLDFLQTDIKDAMLMLGYAFDEKHSPSIPPTQSR